MTTSDKHGSVELWQQVVERIIVAPTRQLTLLDLCCNECTATRRLHCYRHVGVDVADWPTRVGCGEFVQEDVLAYMAHTADKAFRLAICSDGIEHLRKEDGWALLKEMARVAQLAIIFTPLGPYMLDEGATHPDAHKSAWLPEELEGAGWEVASYPKWHPTLGCGAFFAWRGRL